MYMCRNVRKWICLTLALLLTVCALPGSADNPSVPANAAEGGSEATDDTVGALRAEIEALRTEQRRLTDEIEAQKGSTAGVCLQKDLMDQQLSVLAAEVACFDRLLSHYDERLLWQEAAYQQLQTAYDAELRILTARLRQDHEEGLPGLLEQFSRSDSLLSLTVGLERSQQIRDYDQKLMESLETKLGELAEVRTATEALRIERNRVAIEQVERLQLFHARLLECGNYLQSLQDSLDRFSYYIQQSQAGEQKADRAIADALTALEAEIARQGMDGYLAAKAEKEALLSESLQTAMEQGGLQKGSDYYADGADYILPLAVTEGQSAAVLTSVGYRTYQVDGRVITDFHGGVDLSAEYGTDVVAAASGIVIAVGYEYGYGHYVAIRHQNGTHTRYAHLGSITVSAGDYVLQGETVGSAGCSGNIAGAGCHFELWIDGARVDPEHYLVLSDGTVDTAE
ncbi:MAG: peptidoglycan DD-metalloendopeptidase family protein [Clostridia bacterium]|nr:peptidoglycan DD-metalloendopeptidase family protein [Clostridia bacterium]